MYHNSRNQSVEAANEQAANACFGAAESYIQRRPDVVPQLKAALQADPECVLANASFGLMLHGARNVAFKPMVVQQLESALKFKSRVSKREQHYVDALALAHDGQLYKMVECLESLLSDDPTDLFALCLLQAELFWLGDLKRSLKTSSSIKDKWTDSIDGYADFLAIQSFDLEEAGIYRDAEALGRKSVELRSDNIWGAHAVAHVLYMENRTEEGVTWLSHQKDEWNGLNQMQFHLSWHQCLFYIEQKQPEKVLEIYDSSVRNREHELMQSMPDLYIDIQNGASMLWRLEHAGVDVGDRWQEMAELVVNRITDVSNPFTSGHFSMVLAAVGDFDSCEAMIKHMQNVADTENHDLSKRYKLAGLPVSVAAVAHRRGDHEKVIEVLMPARNDLWQMGGSHAQQDVFFQILVDSTYKKGDIKTANLLLQEIEKLGFSEPSMRVGYEYLAG